MTEDQWAIAIVQAQQENRLQALDTRMQTIETQRLNMLDQQIEWLKQELRAQYLNVSISCDLNCTSSCF